MKREREGARGELALELYCDKKVTEGGREGGEGGEGGRRREREI